MTEKYTPGGPVRKPGGLGSRGRRMTDEELIARVREALADAWTKREEVQHFVEGLPCDQLWDDR